MRPFKITCMDWCSVLKMAAYAAFDVVAMDARTGYRSAIGFL